MTSTAIQPRQLLLRNRKAPQSIEHFHRGIAPRPRSAEAWRNFGIALAEMNDLEGAREQLEALVALEPKYVPARMARGRILLKNSRKSAAAEEFRAALAIEPQSPAARAALAEAAHATQP